MQKLFLLLPKSSFDRSQAESIQNKTYDQKRLNTELGNKGIYLYTWAEYLDAINNQDIDVLDFWLTQINFIN